MHLLPTVCVHYACPVFCIEINHHQFTNSEHILMNTLLLSTTPPTFQRVFENLGCKHTRLFKSRVSVCCLNVILDVNKSTKKIFHSSCLKSIFLHFQMKIIEYNSVGYILTLEDKVLIPSC